MMIDTGHLRLSILRQCELASISRSTFYRKPTAENEATLLLMRLIDEQFLETPWYDSRQMVRHLRRNGWSVGRHLAAPVPRGRASLGRIFVEILFDRPRRR
jgi:putative transposase